LGEGWAALVVSIVLAVGVYIASKGYAPLNHGPYRIFLRTPLDQAIPLVKPFVVPYITLQGATYLSLVVFLLVRVRVYQSAAIALILTFLVSYLCFAVLQTYVDRPRIVGDDTFSAMIRSVYAADAPYNDFPSLHVAIATLLAMHWVRLGRVLARPWALWAFLVVLSTVLIHQHYLADVAGGLALAVATSRISLARFANRRDERARRLRNISRSQ
jgi:membrane-associated phospholipid phosphatase